MLVTLWVKNKKFRMYSGRRINSSRVLAPHSKSRIQKTVKGSGQPLVFAVILFLFLVGGGYLYSVNQNAVQGFHMRNLEREINALKEENAQLQIEEADKRSLARIEEAVKQKEMQKVNEVVVISEDGPIALR